MQGLGLPGLSEQRVVPPFFNMVRTGLLDSPVFSIWLSADISGSSHPAGELLFGGVDTRRYRGQMHYHPVIGSRCDNPPPLGQGWANPEACLGTVLTWSLLWSSSPVHNSTWKRTCRKAWRTALLVTHGKTWIGFPAHCAGTGLSIWMVSA